MHEQALSFSLAVPTGSTAESDAIARLFLRLYEAIDAGDVSWIQGTLTIVADSKEVSKLVHAVESAGMQASVRDQ